MIYSGFSGYRIKKPWQDPHENSSLLIYFFIPASTARGFQRTFNKFFLPEVARRGISREISGRASMDLLHQLCKYLHFIVFGYGRFMYPACFYPVISRIHFTQLLPGKTLSETSNFPDLRG